MKSKDEYIKDLEVQNESLTAEVSLLKEEVNLLKLRLYGQSSEKTKPDKDLKFNEAEESVDKIEDISNNEIEENIEEDTSSHKTTDLTKPENENGRKGRRKQLNPAIPRNKKRYELSPSELNCPCGEEGCIKKIGEKERELLNLIPAKIEVTQIIETSYKKSCTGEIFTTKAPKRLIPKSDVDTGLLTTLIVGKYDDHIPLYRHEEILLRLGLDISRSTTSRWVIQFADACQSLINLMKEDMQKSSYVQCDETPTQVIKEKGREAKHKSYMWVLRNMEPNHPMVLFNYEQSRSKSTAASILEGINGVVQTDGYAVYNNMGPLIIFIACWAHARRKFDEAVKASNKYKCPTNSKMKTLGEIGLQFINLLYRIEALANKQNYDRGPRAKRLLDTYKKWLIKTQEIVPPKSLVGKAINYTLGIWEKLYKAGVDKNFKLDNNLCENAIRPFALGRRNWLFAFTPKGATASAIIFSLIESAKLNGLNSYEYIFDLIEKLPLATKVEDFEKLLPYNWKSSSQTS